tara:strand:+ start:58 stop:1695 length:1638 start_codon:yes stop_codon:yes gene_type:complete
MYHRGEAQLKSMGDCGSKKLMAAAHDPTTQKNSSIVMTMLLVTIFVSPIFSGCLSSQEEPDNNILTYEHEIIWVRIEGKYLATIDINSTLTLRDRNSEEIVVEQKLEGTMIPFFIKQCDFSELTAGPCLMMNGDFSAIDSFRKLHLNICHVRNYTMDIDKCQFLDYSAVSDDLIDRQYDDSDALELIKTEQSNHIYAVTYPTLSGTFRLYSNNTAHNLDSGSIYLIPIPTSCDETWAYNCDNWPTTEEDRQSDTDIWYWFSPMGMPYTSNEGTKWYVQHCRNRPSNSWYETMTVYELEEEGSGNHSWSIYEQTESAGCPHESYWEDIEAQQHPFSASLFWSRLMLTCNHYFHHEILHEMYNAIKYDTFYCSRGTGYGEATIDEITPYDYIRGSSYYQGTSIPSWDQFLSSTVIYFADENMVHVARLPSELVVKESETSEVSDSYFLFGAALIIVVLLILGSSVEVEQGSYSPPDNWWTRRQSMKETTRIFRELGRMQVEHFERTGELVRLFPKSSSRSSSRYYDDASDVGDSGSGLGDTMADDDG